MPTVRERGKCTKEEAVVGPERFVRRHGAVDCVRDPQSQQERSGDEQWPEGVGIRMSWPSSPQAWVFSEFGLVPLASFSPYHLIPFVYSRAKVTGWRMGQRSCLSLHTTFLLSDRMAASLLEA